MANKDVVLVGRIGGAYGVRGWVHINSFTEPRENLLSYSPWLIVEGANLQPMKPLSVKSHGNGLIAQFAGINSREQAQGLNATDLFVSRDTLPGLEDEDEFYWRDLVGLEVFNADGRHLGRVSYLLETGAHDVLVIEARKETVNNDGDGDVLIPFTAEFVGLVDIVAGRLEVDW